jgi:hypothetical protein
MQGDPGRLHYHLEHLLYLCQRAEHHQMRPLDVLLTCPQDRSGMVRFQEPPKWTCQSDFDQIQSTLPALTHVPRSFGRLLNCQTPPLLALVLDNAKITEYCALQCTKLLLHYKVSLCSELIDRDSGDNDMEHEQELEEACGQSILHLAASWPTVIDLLLTKYPDLQYQLTHVDPNRRSGHLPLHVYCINRFKNATFSIDILERLLRMAKVSIDRPTNDSVQATALMLACRHGNVDIVQTLIEHFGASMLARDFKGRTIMHYACLCATKNVYDLVSYLLQRIAHLEPTITARCTSVTARTKCTIESHTYACESDTESELTPHALIDNPDRYNCYPLEIACNTNRPLLIQMLLVAGAKPHNLHALLLPFSHPRKALQDFVLSHEQQSTFAALSPTTVPASPFPDFQQLQVRARKPIRWWMLACIAPVPYYTDWDPIVSKARLRKAIRSPTPLLMQRHHRHHDHHHQLQQLQLLQSPPHHQTAPHYNHHPLQVDPLHYQVPPPSATITWLGSLWGTQRHVCLLNDPLGKYDMQLDIHGRTIYCHRVCIITQEYHTVDVARVA